MNKGRVEAYTDGVVAILTTIMVLEFVIPNKPTFSELLQNWTYFVAYLISFLFIGVAWYNHHYMLTLTKKLTKKLYWLNNFWILTMSLLPAATAWAGRFINDPQPELFYFIVFALWSLAYILLSRGMIEANEVDHPEIAERFRNMPVYRVHTSVWFVGVAVIVALLILYVWPPISLVFTVIDLIAMAALPIPNSDPLK